MVREMQFEDRPDGIPGRIVIVAGRIRRLVVDLKSIRHRRPRLYSEGNTLGHGGHRCHGDQGEGTNETFTNPIPKAHSDKVRRTRESIVTLRVVKRDSMKNLCL